MSFLLYGGFERDGKYITCKFDYHKDNQTLKPGTPNSIAHSLGFENVAEMEQYIRENL